MDDNVRIFKCCSTIHLITMSKNVTKSLMIIKSTKITDRALNRQSTGFEKQFRYYSKQNGFHPTSFALFKIKREAVSYRFKLHLPSSQICEPSYQCYGGSIFVIVSEVCKSNQQLLKLVLLCQEPQPRVSAWLKTRKPFPLVLMCLLLGFAYAI